MNKSPKLKINDSIKISFRFLLTTYHLPLTTILLTSCLLLLTSISEAVNPQSWYKKMGQQRGRRSYSKHTSVAAVRGIDEPSEVDPKARDYDSLGVMEARKIDSAKLTQFIAEGKLKENPSPSHASQDNTLTKNASEILSQSAVTKEMKEAIRPITKDEEIQIGKEVAANITAQFGLVPDEALNEYVTMVGQTVSLSAPRRDIVYHFGILNTDVINAYAAPGGYVFITKGLLKILKNEAQLACVLGHEISHVTQKHVLKEIQKSKIASAAIPEHIKAAAQKSQWMSQVTDLSIQMLWKGLSREDELEADKLGVEFAGQSGYDAQSYRDILDILKLKYNQSTESKELKFLISSHPKPEERISAINQKIDSLPKEGVLLEERFKKNLTI